MRRVAENISQDVAEIYRQHDVQFEPKWFPVFRLLAEQSPITATEIADQLGVTHSAINQIAQELVDQGYIESESDKQDKRRRLFVLTSKGKSLVSKLESVWIKIKMAIDDLLEESGGQFLFNLYSLETCLGKQSLSKRVGAMSHNQQDVQIVRYEPAYRKHFADLNIEWISKYFAIEKADETFLGSPESILAGGGEIFFALCDKQVVGTVALVSRSPEQFQLAKMAVSAKFQGLGIGKKLLNACIHEARRRGAKVITLGTVSVLKVGRASLCKSWFCELQTGSTLSI